MPDEIEDFELGGAFARKYSRAFRSMIEVHQSICSVHTMKAWTLRPKAAGRPSSIASCYKKGISVGVESKVGGPATFVAGPKELRSR